MAKLSEILGENYNTLSDDMKNKYKEVDLVDSSTYVKKELFDNKETELTTTKGLLKDANKEIKSYKDMDIDAIKKSADDYKVKFEKAEVMLEKQNREFAAKEFLNQYNFANDRSKKSVLGDFLEKDFKLENDKFLGAEDWIKALVENEPEVFKSEEVNTDTSIQFSKKINGGGTETTPKTLSELMQAKNSNPNVDISFK
ncbi:MAG: phage scaffolding protein [Peptostreptococcaceae bacterium]